MWKMLLYCLKCIINQGFLGFVSEKVYMDLLLNIRYKVWESFSESRVILVKLNFLEKNGVLWKSFLWEKMFGLFINLVMYVEKFVERWFLCKIEEYLKTLLLFEKLVFFNVLFNMWLVIGV